MNTRRITAGTGVRTSPAARWRASLAAALHPALFSLYAVLALLATNINETDIADAYRSLGVAMALAAVVFLCWWLIVHDGPKAGLLASLCLLAFYSYGHAYTLLKTISLGGLLLGRHRFLGPVFVVLLVLGATTILRMRRRLEGTTRVLNVVAAVALIGPVVTLGSVLAEKRTASPIEGAPTQTLSPIKPMPAESRPDIYYIMVDAYAGSEMLHDRFAYDNSGFEDYLTGRGFYVATDSHSNYAHTALSAASSLNMDYLQEPPARPRARPLPGEPARGHPAQHRAAGP